MLAATSSTIRDRNYEARRPCLVLNLRGKAFLLLLLNVVAVVGFSYLPFISVRKLLFGPRLQRIYLFFIRNGYWILPNSFFLAFWEIVFCYYGFFFFK